MSTTEEPPHRGRLLLDPIVARDGLEPPTRRISQSEDSCWSHSRSDGRCDACAGSLLAEMMHHFDWFGMSSVNADPRPGSLVTSMRAPLDPARRRDTASPRPVPPLLPPSSGVT